MDAKTCWVLISFICFQAAWSFNFQDKTMSDCWNAGIRCSNRSSCKFDLDKNNLTCFCVAGFKGDLCDEDRNECDIGSAPCKKRGVCHNSIGSFRCDCLPGWKGSHCERSDGSGQSVCLTGYTGINCTEDFDECTQWVENPCEHGSTCVNVPGNFTCRCATGWEGRICNEDINECNLTSGLCHNGGNCTNIPGSYRCDCPYPYTGAACDDISTTQSTTTSTTTKPTPTQGSTSSRAGKTPGTPLAGKTSTGTKINMLGMSKTSWPATSSATTSTQIKSSTLIGAGMISRMSSPGTPIVGKTTTAKNENGQNTMSTTLLMSPGYNKSSNSTGKPNTTSAGTASPLKIPSGDSADDSGGSHTGAIVGAVVGILVVCCAIGAGILVYHKYFRNPQKIGDANGAIMEKQADTGEMNKNTKWKPEPPEQTENKDITMTENTNAANQ